MKASDTVMNQAETTKFIDKWLNGEVEARHVTEAIAKQQAEITWEVCIKEVVEWIEKHSLDSRGITLHMSQERWRAYKKSLGIV